MLTSGCHVLKSASPMAFLIKMLTTGGQDARHTTFDSLSDVCNLSLPGMTLVACWHTRWMCETWFPFAFCSALMCCGGGVWYLGMRRRILVLSVCTCTWAWLNHGRCCSCATFRHLTDPRTPRPDAGGNNDEVFARATVPVDVSASHDGVCIRSGVHRVVDLPYHRILAADVVRDPAAPFVQTLVAFFSTHCALITAVCPCLFAAMLCMYRTAEETYKTAFGTCTATASNNVFVAPRLIHCCW